ncbi:MAG TPA: peptide-methionine (S)-S-oxide reductase MsrA [Thermoplasmata archaeon]|nr:peptide-methionine (S)-S-oxide reductase MsrA [Thermoplasmata archaeon]
MTVVPRTQEEEVVLGGGCFWCTEAVFSELAGVRGVEPGYAGGHVPDPTYEQVCEGTTGHAEVVRVEFDPSVISFADLLRVFFTIHDPTTRNRQGADTGPQYRSVVLFETPEQRATAEAVVREMEGAHLWRAPIVTELRPLERFYPAEEYHREYFRRNPSQGYCRLVIEPKVAKFRKAFRDRLARPAA